MSAPSSSGSRRLRPALIAAGVLASIAATAGFVWTSRAKDAERARAAAGAELDALKRCLIGAPLQEGETLAGRMRGIELAIALTRADLEAEEEATSRADADAGTGTDAGTGMDAPKALGDPWPARCAPLADKLARALESAALGADKNLDALREALPTRARLEMPYALRADESDDLTTALAKANLPAPGSPPDPATPPAPSPLTAPLATGDLKPLARGKLPLSPGAVNVAAATDPLATRSLHLLLNDTKTTRLCALDPDAPKGPYATAKCGDLPAEWMTNVRLAHLQDGAPTAFFVVKRPSPSSANRSDSAQGVVVFAPGGQKALPMSSPLSLASAYIAKDGAYMLTAVNYASFIRVGSVDKLKTTDIDQPLSDTETARALPPNVYESHAAYGHVFWTDPISYYDFQSPTRDLWIRKVLPAVAPAEASLGVMPSPNIGLRAGCQGGGRTAVLFSDTRRSGASLSQVARIAVAEGDGAFKGFDAEVGATLPHLTCAPDAAVVTSVKPASAKGRYVVLESRCTAAGCETRASDPIAVLAGVEVDAATLDSGVVFLWKMRPDQATSAARDMAFYHFAPLDKLAATPPRPLLENKRHGGIDVDHIHLIHRGPAAIVALESGGKTPISRAVRIDANGVATPVHVEETKW